MSSMFALRYNNKNTVLRSLSNITISYVVYPMLQYQQKDIATIAKKEKEETSNTIYQIGSVAKEKQQIPAVYTEYTDVFSEELADIIAPNTQWDHKIDINDKMPPYRPIYNLFQPELILLQDYFDSVLKKGWIRESNSPAGASILFVSKADGTLYLYINYRGLNSLIKKNRYPLLLISEILDRLSGAIVFTKLDLCNAYHRLQIKARDKWKTAFKI